MNYFNVDFYVSDMNLFLLIFTMQLVWKSDMRIFVRNELVISLMIVIRVQGMK